MDSGDYNGLSLGGGLPDGWDAARLRALVTDGLVQAVTYEDYPNVHIRPWASQRSTGDQAADVDAVVAGTGSCCLYPTPAALKHRPLPHLAGQPYAEAIARGSGALELVFFEMSAFEPYRNDPRYRFMLDDFGFTFGIGDDAYMDAGEPEHDKVHTVRAGFGFSGLGSAPDSLQRFACAFHTDLWRLTPRHQQRLRTWEVDQPGLEAHPIWWRMQMGHWAEHIGPFDKILAEMEALNEIWEIYYGSPLFRTTDRPRDWGWVLRASTNEWDAFVLTTDKLLSDNMVKAALDATGVPSKDASGGQIGSLNRLEQFFVTKTTADPGQIKDVLRPLRDVRKQRQRPAHGTAEPLTDRNVYGKQRQMLIDVALTLQTLRRFLARQPRVRRAGWTADDHIDKWLTL